MLKLSTVKVKFLGKEGIHVTEQFVMIILLIALGYFLKRINYLKSYR